MIPPQLICILSFLILIKKTHKIKKIILTAYPRWGHIYLYLTAYVVSHKQPDGRSKRNGDKDTEYAFSRQWYYSPWPFLSFARPAKPRKINERKCSHRTRFNVTRYAPWRDFATPGDVRVQKSVRPVGFQTQTSCTASDLQSDHHRIAESIRSLLPQSKLH